MSQKSFWSGVAVGSGAALALVARAERRGSVSHRGVIRVERSVQIGADLGAIFRAWAHFERIPQYCRFITHVHATAPDRHEWTANVDGRILHWESEITQVIPNQVIGWKSVSGPKHTGRIFFAPIGRDTLVHVHMNYEPTFLERSMMSSLEIRIQDYVEAALRDFKAEMEGLEQESMQIEDEREVAELLPANVRIGNFGSPRPEKKQPRSERPLSTAALERNGTFGAGEEKNKIDYTRPPEKGNLKNE